MDEPLLKVDEVAAILKEPKHTVRNWLRDFRDWIPVTKAANGYNVFPPEAVEKMKLIRHLIRDRGFSTRQVAHHLATGGDIPSASVAVPDDVAELKQMVKQLAAAQEEQMKLQRAILERLDERDRQLTQFLIERREKQARQLPAPEARPWWMFWK